jgi:protein DJ-1
LFWVTVCLSINNLCLKDVADKSFDAVILPGGGKGAENLAASESVKIILKNHQNSGKILAAICAAPIAFKAHGIGKGKTITSYPCFKVKLISNEIAPKTLIYLK